MRSMSWCPCLADCSPQQWDAEVNQTIQGSQMMEKTGRKPLRPQRDFLSVVLPRIRGHSPAGVATSGPPYIILEDERLYKNWTVCQIWEQNNQGPANWDPTLFQSWGYTQGACY